MSLILNYSAKILPWLLQKLFEERKSLFKRNIGSHNQARRAGTAQKKAEI